MSICLLYMFIDLVYLHSRATHILHPSVLYWLDSWLMFSVLHIMTSSYGNIFRVTGHLCGEFTGPRWSPRKWPVTRTFDIFFDLRLNKRLNKQSWGWWFEILWCPLWRHCNDTTLNKEYFILFWSILFNKKSYYKHKAVARLTDYFIRVCLEMVM